VATIYKLAALGGDTVAVPRLIFSHLPRVDGDTVRVALYVLDKNCTDPRTIARDLGLKSIEAANRALQYWSGAGLLEPDRGAPAAAAPEQKPAAEIDLAAINDPYVAVLCEEAQTAFGKALGRSDLQRLVGLYLNEGWQPDVLLLCCAEVARQGRRTVGAVSRELGRWREAGVETGEEADAHLKLLALREKREAYVASLLETEPAALTLGGKKAIARWYEVYGYDDAMVQEAAVQAGPKRDLWYWNSILKTWNAKGLRTVRDVRGPVPVAGASRNIRVDREAPSGNDFLQGALDRPRRHKRKD